MEARPSRGAEVNRQQTVLVLIGIPGAGKTTLAGRLAQCGWQPVNQDVLGTRKKCEATCREALAAGKSVVIDRCNFNAQQRAVWVQLARSVCGSNVRVVALQLVVPPSVCKERVRLQRLAAGRPAPPDRPGGEDIVDSFASELTQVEWSEGFDELYSLSAQEQVDAFFAYIIADSGTDGQQAATDGANEPADGDSAHTASGSRQQGASDAQVFGPTDGNTGRGPTDGNTGHAPTDGNTGRGPTDGNTRHGPTDGNTMHVPTDGNTRHAPTDGNTRHGSTDGNTRHGSTDDNIGRASSSQQYDRGSAGASSSSNRPVAVVAVSMADGAGSSYHEPVHMALPGGSGGAPGGSLSVQIAYVSPMQYPPGAWVAPPAAAAWYAAPPGQWGHPMQCRYPGMPQGWSPQLPPLALQPAHYVQAPGGVAVPAAALSAALPAPIPAPIPAAVPAAVFGVAMDGPHHQQQQADLRNTDSFAGSSASAGDGAEPAMRAGSSGAWHNGGAAAGSAAGGARWGPQQQQQHQQQQQPWLGAVRQQAPQARRPQPPQQQGAGAYGPPHAAGDQGYWRNPGPAAAASPPSSSWGGSQEPWQQWQGQQHQQQPWQPSQGRQQQRMPQAHSAAEAAVGFGPASGSGAWGRRIGSGRGQQQQQQQQSPGTWVPGQYTTFNQQRQQQQQQRYGAGRPGQQLAYQAGPGALQQDPYPVDWHMQPQGQQPQPPQPLQQSPADMQSWRRLGPLQQHTPQQQQAQQQQQQQGRQAQQPRPGYQEEIEQLTAMFASAAPGARLDGPCSIAADSQGELTGGYPPGAGANSSTAGARGSQGSQLQSVQQGHRIVLLFDLNGTLTSHTSRRRSAGRNRLRPGLEHLARLLGSFRLGIFTSSTVHTVAHVKQMIEESVGQALFEPGLIMHRDHTRPATRKHKRASGKAWDTVKPLGTWFWRLQHVVLFDDDPNKAVPGEELNVVRVPCWDADANDDLIKRLVDGVLEVFAPLGPHDDVRQHTPRLQAMLYEGVDSTAAAAAAAAALQQRPVATAPGGAPVAGLLVVAEVLGTREAAGAEQGAAGAAGGDDSVPAAPAQAQSAASTAAQQAADPLTAIADPAAAPVNAAAAAAAVAAVPTAAVAAVPTAAVAAVPTAATAAPIAATGVPAAATAAASTAPTAATTAPTAALAAAATAATPAAATAGPAAVGLLLESAAKLAHEGTSPAASEGKVAEALRNMALA